MHGRGGARQFSVVLPFFLKNTNSKHLPAASSVFWTLTWSSINDIFSHQRLVKSLTLYSNRAVDHFYSDLAVLGRFRTLKLQCFGSRKLWAGLSSEGLSPFLPAERAEGDCAPCWGISNRAVDGTPLHLACSPMKKLRGCCLLRSIFFL